MLLLAVSLAATSRVNATSVVTVGGNVTQGAGFNPGPGTTNSVAARFHNPMGLALDSTEQYLFVSDYSNNAVRVMDLDNGWTGNFGTSSNGVANTNLVNRPVGLAVDSSDNIFVLNAGKGTNGSLVEFDWYGDYLGTLATGISNAAGLALDFNDDIYVTAGNKVLLVSGGTVTNFATITNANAQLKGIALTGTGFLAVCDAGRNGIYAISQLTGVVTTNSGFNGAGDKFGSTASAQFSSPYGITAAGNALVVADSGNNRVKVITASGIVTNLYGVDSNFWYTGSGSFPGWKDGAVAYGLASQNYDLNYDVEARNPVGLTIGSDGTVFVSEDFYHLIREVTGGSLSGPLPPPPQLPTPQIGWVDFEGDDQIGFFSVLHPGTSFVFNNDTLLAIEGTNGSQVFFQYGPTPPQSVIPDPSPTNGYSAPSYRDGLPPDEYVDLTSAGLNPLADFTIKAIDTKADGSPDSAITSCRIQYVTATPSVFGNNAAAFYVSNITDKAEMYYTIDGSTPTNGAPSIGPISAGALLSVDGSSNITFKIQAFRLNYQPSPVATFQFSPTNYVPNSISFGFASGEASSRFIGSPGQNFYAPITLSVLPSTLMYSLQFNVTVTNVGAAPAISPGDFGFQSMLMQPGVTTNTTLPVFVPIPPWMFAAYSTAPPPSALITNSAGQVFINLEDQNDSLNLLTVGWVERFGFTNLYNTLGQDLIQYSIAHDDLFLQGDGKVIVGGYQFQIPANATAGQQYQIQLGRASASSDGVGAPGSAVFVNMPTNGSLAAGPVNSIKLVTVGQFKYLVGDAYPFGWFNAGDFGSGTLSTYGSSDVEQVFEAAAYGVNAPPANSDFFDCMDSSGHYGVYDSAHGYYVDGGPLSLNDEAALYSITDPTALNTNMFGDGVLDISDVFVTYIRSVDSDGTLNWIQRFWTNGVRGALPVPNGSVTSNAKSSGQNTLQSKVQPVTLSITNQSKVNFSAGDIQGSANQVVQIPVYANILGNYPLRMLGLNLSVVPLDGSPDLTAPVSFALNPQFTTTNYYSKSFSSGNGNYSTFILPTQPLAKVSGFSGNILVGTLTVTIPATATSLSAYAVHFDHASASPNGMASFPNQKLTGLITLSSRTSSSFGDNIPDSWRLRYFGTTNNLLSAASADADGDGCNNWQEYVAGTDPTDPSSKLVAGNNQAEAQQPGDSVVSWPSVSGKQYIIFRSPTLFPPAWTAISTNLGTGGVMEIHDLSGGNGRFYRVSVQ